MTIGPHLRAFRFSGPGPGSVAGYDGPMSAARLAAIAFTALLLSCAGDSSRRQGESCVATSQCVQGLICDQVQKVCAMMGSPVDAPVPVDAEEDDASIDARLMKSSKGASTW